MSAVTPSPKGNKEEVTTGNATVTEDSNNKRKGGNPNAKPPKRKKKYGAHLKKKKPTTSEPRNVTVTPRRTRNMTPDPTTPHECQDISSDSDALPDPEEEEITVDYLEALSRRALPNQDEFEWTDLDARGRRVITFEQKRARRMGIYYHFTQVYQSVPESSGLWKGKNGIPVRIRDILCLPKSTNLRRIKAVMRLILAYQSRSIPYDGSAEGRKEWTRYIIPLDSYEAEMVADCMEAGFGLDFTTWKVNLYRLEEGEEHVGRSSVYQAMLRLKPEVTAITKRPQGNMDPSSNFCQANYRWATQLLLMYGDLDQKDVPEMFKVNGDFPECFQSEKLRKLKLEQITWFDESHKKQKVGRIKNGKNIQMRFKRNEEGKPDPEGEYLPRGYEVAMKFAKEARFCYGCVLEIDDKGNMKKNSKDQPLGKTLPLFEYTDATIMTNTDWLKVFWQAAKAPQQLKTAKAPWVENTRIEGVVYSGDPVDKLPKMGTTMKKLMLDRGVETVEEFATYFHNHHPRRKAIVQRVKGLSMESLLRATHIAEAAPKGPPALIDHRKNKNPYFSRFGKNLWRDEVLKSAIMKTVVNVQDLVEYIVRVSREHFKGTVYEDDWYFYHDALTLMTAVETTDWMKNRGYYKHWILPEFGLNQHLKYYTRVQPVGNNPGAMCWDNSLNKDCDDIALRHVAATSLLNRDDPRKFSLATPKHVSSTYRRLFNNPPVLRDGQPICPVDQGCLPPARIGQDIVKIIPYWRQVFESNGANINTNTNGHRGNEARAKKKGNRGGQRFKKTREEMTDYWIHPDAQESVRTFQDIAKDAYSKALAKVKAEYGTMTLEKQECHDPESLLVLTDQELVPRKRVEDEDNKNESDCEGDDL